MTAVGRWYILNVISLCMIVKDNPGWLVWTSCMGPFVASLQRLVGFQVMTPISDSSNETYFIDIMSLLYVINKVWFNIYSNVVCFYGNSHRRCFLNNTCRCFNFSDEGPNSRQCVHVQSSPHFLFVTKWKTQRTKEKKVMCSWFNSNNGLKQGLECKSYLFIAVTC